MTDEQAERLIHTLREHGNQLGSNLAFLKTFMDRLQQEQREFLAEQHKATEKAQKNATRAAIASAVAAVAAAAAAVIQAWDAVKTP